MSPLNAAICTTTTRQKCYGPGKKILFKNNYLTLRSNVKVPWRSLRYATNRLMVMHPHTKYNWPISKDKNVMARTRKYYLKNNYLTLRSKVKVPRRSLRHIVLVWLFLPLLLLPLSEATITFLSFQIGQLYLVCGCLTIRRCVAYRNDLRGTLTFDLKVK
jgi:hypothetical protein